MKSITVGFDEIKDMHLGLNDSPIGKPPRFRQISACQSLCEQAPHLDGAALASALIDRATRNWKTGPRAHLACTSSENWRFRQADKIAQGNPSKEVTFERAFIKRATKKRWANQVPTCSGVVTLQANRRTAIDLVEKTGSESFDFIELKIKSDTPLFAALEVLDYGVLYVFSRTNRYFLGYTPGCREILDAHHIGLRVLAPLAFYKKYTLSWLDTMMHTAAKQLASMIDDGTVIDFRFDAFPEPFRWDKHGGSGYAVDMMADRRPLTV